MAAKNSSIICKSLAASVANDIQEGLFKEAAHTIILLIIAFECDEDILQSIIQQVNQLSPKQKKRQIEYLFERIKWAEVVSSDNVFTKKQQKIKKQKLVEFISALKENFIELQSSGDLDKIFSKLKRVALDEDCLTEQPLVVFVRDDTKKTVEEIKVGATLKRIIRIMITFGNIVVKRGKSTLMDVHFDKDLDFAFPDSEFEKNVFEDDAVKIEIIRGRFEHKLVVEFKKF